MLKGFLFLDTCFNISCAQRAPPKGRHLGIGLNYQRNIAWETAIYDGIPNDMAV